MKRFLAPIPLIAIVLIVATSTYAAVKLLGTANRGLVLDWKMDEGAGTTLTDNSGNGYSGTLYGGTLPTWVDLGRFGKAISFDGSDQYAESDTPISSLGVADAPYSISTWVTIAPGETNGNIVHISNGENGYGWCIPFLAVIDGKFSAISYNSGAIYATQSDTPSTGQWHHVVETWSAAHGLQLYVDGVLKETTTQSNFTAAGDSVYVQLARGSGGCVADTGFFEGSMDDTRVYDRELSHTQINALYSSNTDSIATIRFESSGLQGDFYQGDNFDALQSSAVDQIVEFNPADESIGTARAGQADHFSARWTGYVTPEYSEEYTFYTSSDDGVRLYVDNELLIDSWVPQGVTEHSGTINLIAGHRYPITLEYYEEAGGAAIWLSWSSNSTPKGVIPGSALSHSGGSTTINDSRNTRIAEGLTGLWSFDGPDMYWSGASEGTAYSRAGNNYHGLLSGMSRATSPVPGAIGQALNFNGTDSCITTSGNIFSNPSAFTVVGWIYPRSYEHIGFFGQNDSIEFGFGGTGILMGWTPAQSISIAVDSGIMPLNKWHHVAFVGTGEAQILYVDGVAVQTSGASIGNYGTDNSDTFSIGCNVWGGVSDTGYFDGKIDDVRAYDRALTAGQIKQLYLMGT